MEIIANDLNPKPSLVLWNARSLLSKAVWAKEHTIDFKIGFVGFFWYIQKLAYISQAFAGLDFCCCFFPAV